MEHLKAERSHISIHCRSDCARFLASAEELKLTILHWLTSEWRELPLQYKINNKPVRLIQ